MRFLLIALVLLVTSLNTLASSPTTNSPSCNSGTPASPVPETVGATRLWTDRLQPADPAGPLPPHRDSTAYNGFQRPGSDNGLPLFTAVAKSGTLVAAAHNSGYTLWKAAADGAIALQSTIEGWTGDFFAFADSGEEFYFKNWDIDLIRPSGTNETFLALSGLDEVGLTFWDVTDPENPVQIYQDVAGVGRQVELAKIGGLTYAFVARTDGLHVYDLSFARLLGSCLENTSQTASCNVWKGRLANWQYGGTVKSCVWRVSQAAARSPSTNFTPAATSGSSWAALSERQRF